MVSDPRQEPNGRVGNSPLDKILNTKLMPPRLQSGLVARPALFERLDEGLDRRLTLVVAPTGFGKTTLVTQWLADRAIRSAWVALDASDDDPVRFWSYVIAALRSFDPAIGRDALAELRTAQRPSLIAILTPFINELAGLDGPRVLVLEDYQAITSGEIHQALAFLLNHLPGALHLVLITRSEPDLPLGLLRARNELAEIDAESLRFNQTETAKFLRRSVPVALGREAVAQLEERTEGWAAGLRLAALALHSKTTLQEAERVLATFSGSHRYVMEYLVGEVFDNLPEETQSFLLHTSVLDRFSAELCSEVYSQQFTVNRKEKGSASSERSQQSTVDCQRFLDHLERDNLFISRLDSAEGQPWYRYHALFAEAIRARARQELGEETLRALCEKASRWYESRRMLDEAIEYALRAKLFDRAAGLIERLVDTQNLSEVHTMRRWAGQLPEEVLRRYPLVSFDYAQTILYTEDRFSPAIVQQVEPLLRIAEVAWSAADDSARLGWLLSIRATMLLWQGDFKRAFDYARVALELLPDEDVAWRGSCLLLAGIEDNLSGRMLEAQEHLLEAQALFGAVQNRYGVLAVMHILGEVYFAQGDLEPSGQLEQQVLAGAVGSDDMLDDRGGAWLGLGQIAYEKNDLETAAKNTNQALEAAEKRGNEQLLAQAAAHMARIEQARGETSAAFTRLQTLAARLRHPAILREVQTAAANLAALNLAEPSLPGNAAFLQAWQAAVDAPDENIFAAQKEREALVLARLRLAEKKTGEALALLNERRVDASTHGRVRSEVEILCLEALAYQAGGDAGRAAQSLTRALAIAQAKGLLRLLLDQGEGFTALLKAVTPGLSRRSLAVYAAALQQAAALAKAPVPEHPASFPAPVEPLSPQELRVLHLLAAGLSNPEIARELVVSTNTIKTQVQSIYRKLNITSREEARQAARELKI